MASSRCAQCGREEFLPFRCKLCAQPHCLDHRLPENHGCTGLGEYRSRAREERVLAVPRGAAGGVRVRVRAPSPAREGLDRARRWFRRSMTHTLLGILILAFLGQHLVGAAYGAAAGLGVAGGVGAVTCQLAMGHCGPGPFDPLDLLTKPWSPLTAIFTHAPFFVNPFHVFFNLIFLYFFGTAFEARVGARRMLGLFLVAGLASTVLQAVVFGGAVVGASGGLMGILGALTVLSPTMQVLFLFVPLPLWVLTVFFAVGDLTGIFGSGAGIANLAHLAGLGAGLAYGVRLRRRGVLPKMASSWAFNRRG